MSKDIENYDLLKILHRAKYLSSSNVQILEQYLRRWSMSAYQAILKTQLLTESDLADALASSLELERIRLICNMNILPATLSILTFREARMWECIALERRNLEDKSFLKLVVTDPTKIRFFSILRERTGCDILCAVGERSDILRAINEFYSIEDQLPSLHSSNPFIE